MKDRLLNTVRPFLSYIDSGNFFREPVSWLYILLAGSNALAPFYMLYNVIDSGVFKYGGARFIFAFLLIWLFMLVASWIGAQIWWCRKDGVLEMSSNTSDFCATPVFSHFLQTLGENYGTFVAIVGTGFSLSAAAFLGEESRMLSGLLNLPLNFGVAGIVFFPIFGYMLIVGSRFVAEQIRALAAIAINTKR